MSIPLIRQSQRTCSHCKQTGHNLPNCAKATLDATAFHRQILNIVDGESGRATINNFVDTELFAADSRALRQYIKSISPDLDLKYTFISDSTGEVKELDIPMGVTFFWPGN